MRLASKGGRVNSGCSCRFGLFPASMGVMDQPVREREPAWSLLGSREVGYVGSRTPLVASPTVEDRLPVPARSESCGPVG